MLLALLVHSLVSNALTNQACPHTARAVVDLGSGSVKMVVAEIESCKPHLRLFKILDDESNLPLALEASKNSKGEIPMPMQEQAVDSIKKLIHLALIHAKKQHFSEFEFLVVGTHAFRTATNRHEFSEFLKKNGFPITALSQEDEARIGYFAARKMKGALGCSSSPLLVWDMGGGSTQITTDSSSPQQPPQVIGLGIGAEKYKAFVLKALNRTSSSPNPIGIENLNLIESKTKGLLQSILPKSSLKNQTSTCVVGIGGVHNKAIYEQIVNQWPIIKSCACPNTKTACPPPNGLYTKKQALCLRDLLSTLTDDSPIIKGPYSSTTPSNSILITALMMALNIDEVHVAKVNMGHYLVSDSSRSGFQRQKVH